MKVLRALLLILALSVFASAGDMPCGKTGEMPNGRAGEMQTGKTGEMDNGKSGDMPNDVAGDIYGGKTIDPATAIALQLLQSVLPLF